MKREVIEKIVKADEKNVCVCPRCGNLMREKQVENALSRYADVYICSDCGVAEAFGGGAHFEEWNVYKELLMGVDAVAGRKRFMSCVGEGLYAGHNIDGEEVIVCVGCDNGMTISTIHKEKPNWYEVVEYDEDGYQVSVSYEAIK